MKVNMTESDNGDWINLTLTPEDFEEATRLLRLVRRRKRISPKIRTTYCDAIETYISFSMNTSNNAPDTGIE